MDIAIKHYNYDYENKVYYEVSYPMHDHYSYDYFTNSFYEDVLGDDNKGYTYLDLQERGEFNVIHN